ncbi:hypothetical protein [Campylobacter sp. RM5063]|uniref:hypothetical protein n=1 Tax=Campylobacter sp. RM5063 TaxID=2735747 RepID=UPI00301D3186|nr:hypothetical protein [Campylobacter sp. RM5063]
MAFVRLSNGNHPRLMVDVNNALNYKDTQTGEIKQRQVATALVDVIEEAGKVVGMDKGAVTASFKVNNEWKNYFVRRDKENFNIVLLPTDPQERSNRDNHIFINNNWNEETDRFYYTINDKREAGKALVEGIGISEFQNQDGSKSFYLDTNIKLTNKEIKEELEKIKLEKGDGYLAIVRSTGFEIKNEAEMKEQKAKQQDGFSKEQTIGQETQVPSKEKDIER